MPYGNIIVYTSVSYPTEARKDDTLIQKKRYFPKLYVYLWCTLARKAAYLELTTAGVSVTHAPQVLLDVKLLIVSRCDDILLLRF